MEIINLIKELEIISSKFPNRVLKLEGIHIHNKEFIEVIIFKGFSSSTTHKIEHDLEKNIIDEDFIFKKCELLRAPLGGSEQRIIKTSEDIKRFLDKNFWN
tara:strand:- start:353 stop:655 length:303 start_codon:yes stop_codon:yes gene_type:complete